jgi:hypothetical protein
MDIITNESAVADEQHDRAVRAVQVAGRFASIITRKDLTVTLVRDTHIPAPAWSTGDSISFHEGRIAGNLHTAEGVMSLKGLTCHEVSHILYTPRAGSNIALWVADEGLHSYWNMLEDMRIERLLTGRFGRAVVPWLTATIAQHLLSEPEAVKSAFPLIHGRTYLPLELRVAVREAFVAQSVVRELASVIDEYVRLVFPRDVETAKALIIRYRDLLKQAGKEANQPEPDGTCGSGSEGFDSSSRPATQKEQERDQQKADKQGDKSDDIPEPTQPTEPVDGDDEDGDQPTDDGDSTDEGEGDGEGEQSGDEQGDESGDEQGGQPGQPTDQQGGQPGEGQSDSDGQSTHGQPSDSDGETSNDGKGGSGAGGAGDSDPDLEDLLESILDDIAKDFAESIHDTLVEIAGGAELEGNGNAAPQQAPFNEFEPSLDARLASNAFGRELEDLQTQFDPGWERETASGKLNVGRYLRGADIDESFDRWQSGRDDAVDIECVIVLDRSGSMSDRMRVAMESMWAIKRALDTIGASTTVVLYGSATSVLYGAHDEATSTVRGVSAGGGTYPVDAVQHAVNVLAQSDRKVKLLLNITDGAWERGADADELIATARRAGVVTALAYITNLAVDSTLVDAHESELVTSVTKTDDLFLLGRELVRVATARNLSVA